jgi:hypothetical protein
VACIFPLVTFYMHLYSIVNWSYISSSRRLFMSQLFGPNCCWTSVDRRCLETISCSILIYFLMRAPVVRVIDAFKSQALTFKCKLFSIYVVNGNLSRHARSIFELAAQRICSKMMVYDQAFKGLSLESCAATLLTVNKLHLLCNNYFPSGTRFAWIFSHTDGKNIAIMEIHKGP